MDFTTTVLRAVEQARTGRDVRPVRLEVGRQQYRALMAETAALGLGWPSVDEFRGMEVMQIDADDHLRVIGLPRRH